MRAGSSPRRRSFRDQASPSRHTQPPGARRQPPERDRRRARRHGSTSLRTGIIITMLWTETALTRLREASGRSGGARRLVVELLGGQTCCLSAQEIHEALRASGGRVGIASVYRALDGLDELA